MAGMLHGVRFCQTPAFLNIFKAFVFPPKLAEPETFRRA